MNNNKKLALLLSIVLLLVIIIGICADRDSGNTGTCTGNYQILITEICAKNDTIIADNDGRFRDYIELYNAGNTINLSNFIITDSSNKETTLSNIMLEHGEYFVVFLSADTTSFGLSASGGDCIQLKCPDGHIVAQTNIAAMSADQVMIYSSGFYRTTSEASPGYENTASGVSAFRDGLPCAKLSVVISEILAENTTVLPDERGQFSDIIELHNVTDRPVRLSGWYLSDNLSQRLRYRLPDVTLAVDEHLAIFCDGENYITRSGQIHTNFGLSAGDVLCLTDPTGAYTSIEISYSKEDLSLIISESGIYDFAEPSPGWPNTQDGTAQFLDSRIDHSPQLIISEVLMSESNLAWNGVLQDVVEIANVSDQEIRTTNWFLTDGGNAYEFPLPVTTLSPEETLVLTISAETTGFSLSEGETLSLTTPEFKIGSPVTCVAGQPGTSMSMYEEGYAFTQPSIGYANTIRGQELFAQETLPSTLIISEVMTGNLSYLLGAYGTGCDWVELFNASSAPINLADYHISDDPTVPDACPLPSITLDPNEYFVILLTDKTENLPANFHAIPLTLSSNGDALYLVHSGIITDQAIIPELAPDVSYGRPVGSAAFSVLSTPTPCAENSDASEICAMPQSLTVQGVYEDIEYLDVVLTGDGEIYYTLDCTAPDADAIQYTGPIRITKTTVIRAECRQPGKLPSRTLDLTFLLNEDNSLPVVSLVLEPDDLWSADDGIYIRGNLGGESEFPYRGANFWQDWEKAASVSLFENDGPGFSVSCGVKIFGNCSRALELKAFSVLFRDAYGVTELRYPLFGEDGLDTYEAFILRASGQDVFNSRMRDVLITSLVEDATNIPVQKYRPTVLYLNGEFWGIYYIREKINEHFVAGNYNVSADTVILSEQNGLDCPEYMDLYNYVITHDMTKSEHYAYVCERMDIDEYINYIVAQMCMANSDNGNVKFFIFEGGKWTWILFDTDRAFYDNTYSAISEHLNPAGTGSEDATSTQLINTLLLNKDFKDQFLRTMAWQLNTIWTEENITRRIDELESLIYHDVERDFSRWGYRYELWQSHMDILRYFAKNRRTAMITQVKSYFHLTNEQMKSYGFIP